MFVAPPRESMTATEQRAYVAVLNSSLITWYFRTIQPRPGRLFAELEIEHLSAFPLPTAGRWADAIGTLAERCRRGQRHGAGAVTARVDAEVENLYELSPTERSETKMSA